MTDRDEIVELTVRYATAIDSLQYSSLTTVFTDDAQLDYGEVGQWTGGAEVAEFMEAAHVGATHTLHRMTNQAVDIDGDAATVRTYVDALILFEGAGVNPIGYYDDHVVRTGDGWRIARRTYTSVAERFFDVRIWEEQPSGGHFSAWEQPERFVTGLRAAVGLAKTA